jgi:hypothetical protein
LLTHHVQVNIAQTDFQRLLDSPVPIRAYLSYGFASTVALSTETRKALARLDDLNELYHSPHYQSPTRAPSDELGITNPQLSDAASIVSLAPETPFKVVVGLLQHCFAEEQRGVLRGFCFIFPGGAGAGFTAAIKASDPMALLILLHWAVLIHRAEGEFWWTKKLGQRLAIGISRAMQLSVPTSPSPALLTPEWSESISWVCTQLNLPEFVYTDM